MKRLTRLPRAAWWCAAVAFLNVSVWSVVTPPFHVPDETAHVAYVQYFAENGKPPNEPGGPVYSTQEARLLESLRFVQTIGRPGNHAIWTEVESGSRRSGRTRRSLATGDGRGTQSNSNQPPLFFTLGAGAYLASPWTGLLERLALMRLVSALLAALTTLFTFLFLREVLVERWTWTVGALAVAFQPAFGFISGGVTPDALLFTASAALFFTLARAFRRGLTTERGLAIGAALAVGALSKLNFLALIPGALIGLGLLVWRARHRIAALRAAYVAAGVLGVAALAYITLNLALWDRTAWGGGIADGRGQRFGRRSRRSGDRRVRRAAELHLAAVPAAAAVHERPVRRLSVCSETWFKGGIGVFGWLDTSFPEWAYTVALWVVAFLSRCSPS